MSDGEEQWRDIENPPGAYRVSSHGRVESVTRTARVTNGYRTVPGRMMEGTLGEGGYTYVVISDAGVRKRRPVHRLVLEAFVGPLPEGMVTRHLDGNPQNNHLENLVYGTPAENVADTLRHGHHFNANQTHCVRGHELNEENTFYNKEGNHRQCRECRRKRSNDTAARIRQDPERAEKSRAYRREWLRKRRTLPKGGAFDD